ncbi:conjugal transfer protein TraH [Bradyrhizobium sp. Pear77]|uniref:TraH family protein n=1 Tax=Bradyrhizobium TaxID=374 RepID=UPI001E361A68|nr:MULTISPECIES: TraH family protein [Bradyrhizobium]MCC8953560.1 conjugal transfer protein TraH [Bradyrhizobium altum]MCC8962926.1 conjugal transfer protein TraH [Bradyrhizobium oropedii]
MIDAATIHQCADPDLKPAIVEKFIRAVGSLDPLAVTIRTGNRVILVTPPKTPDDAMELVRRYVGQAMVRVGVTQYPAGLGISDVAELKPDLIDACANLRMGTALFGKVYRIVTKWYGAPVDEAFGDAIDAWKTGYFDGKYVFDEPDPGSLPVRKPQPDSGDEPVDGNDAARSASGPVNGTPQEPDNPNKAGIRIDLTGIGVSKPK